MKRIIDLIISLNALVILLPFFVLIAIVIKIDSRGPVFYLQERIGKGMSSFFLIKFRTMFINSDKIGLLTIGRDSRITRVGSLLRKYKIDELPQFFNVLKGEMSIVGPRPEVAKYVEFYTERHKDVFLVKPGITDYASLEFFDENEILGKSSNPESSYIKDIMPLKLEYNLWYIKNNNVLIDFKIIISTLLRILGKKFEVPQKLDRQIIEKGNNFTH